MYIIAPIWGKTMQEQNACFLRKSIQNPQNSGSQICYQNSPQEQINLERSIILGSFQQNRCIFSKMFFKNRTEHNFNQNTIYQEIFKVFTGVYSSQIVSLSCPIYNSYHSGS